MKLLHTVGNFKLPQNPHDSVSGVVRAALEIARSQAQRGHKVTLVSVGSSSWQTTWQGVTLRQLAAVSWARASFGGRTLDLGTHLPLLRLTQREAFDIVQGHLYYYLRFVRAGARIAHFHADPLYGADEMSAQEAKCADFHVIAQCTEAQVAVSHYIAGQIGKGMSLCNEWADVHTIHNGVRHEHFGSAAAARRGGELRAELGIPADAVVFLFVGAIVPEKGFHHLAEAFRRLAPGDPRIHLLVAGSASLWDMNGHLAETSYEVGTAKRLCSLLRAGRVHLLGTVKSSEMPAVYAASDVTVVPSVWPEPFGLVALESLAAGKPVIASEVGGLPELVAPDNGQLVPPADEEALAAAMRAFTNPQLRAERGRAARASSAEFSWDGVAQGLEHVYEAALAVRA